MGLEPTMDYVCRTVWGMLYADDDGTILLLPQGLAAIMEVIVEVAKPSL